MFIKEYRICMPMSVEEYRIGQLYMIQKKSRTESSGSGSGVEILTNEPYADGPGGAGQYTLKIYHVGSHLPGWIRSILPKSVHIEEEAWNAYPYTKTIYRCPFIEKFVMEIETVYYNDPGSQDNVFDLSTSDLSSRVVDYIDMVKDPISSSEYQVDEDPTKFVSIKTGRGPLSENWREEYSRVCGGSDGGRQIMCAYKLCRVEFNYWGMQSKVERFIHDFALRRIMVRAHRQAWCWQDEYHGLTIEDIRRLELETQMKLRETMASSSVDHAAPECRNTNVSEGRAAVVTGQTDSTNVNNQHHSESLESRKLSLASVECKHIEKLQNVSSEEEEDEEEYFDADEAFTPTQRRSSLDPATRPSQKPTPLSQSGAPLQTASSQSLPSSPTMERKNPLSSLDLGGSEILFILLHGGSIVDSVDNGAFTKSNDLSTLNSTFESVIRSRYPSMSGKIFIEMISCPNLCNKPTQLLLSLSTQESGSVSEKVAENRERSGQECHHFGGLLGVNFPLSSVVLLGINSPNYSTAVNQVRLAVNKCFSKFCRISLQRTGVPFGGQVCILADAIGSLIAFDLLTPPTSSSSNQKSVATSSDIYDAQNQEDIFVDFPDDQSPTVADDSFENCMNEDQNVLGDQKNKCGGSAPIGRHLSCPGPTIGQTQRGQGLDFDVDEVFLFGAPLGIVLAYRFYNELYPMGHLPKPSCNQMYNLFYPSDPCALRVEPLLDPKFKFVDPIKLPRFNKFTNDEILSLYLVETLHSRVDLFCDTSSSNGATDTESVYELPSGGRREGCTRSQVQSVSLNWWGTKRIDYSVYCPEALQNFPASSLPHLLHSSFWESCDLIAFVLRQVLKQDQVTNEEDTECFRAHPGTLTPKEKWLKRRTTLKVRNIAPNHRANDVIVMEGKQQTLVARFMYGPLDVVSLSGEKVDIFITIRGQREHMATEVTDTNGRAVYNIPNERRLPIGLYPIQMIVRVDQSSANFLMAVLPSKTEVVVFSIDGSFTASVSILGRDPKVRPGAVDVVRHWHDYGYLVLYVTARPDMQHRRVVRWLAQHNFPQGLIWFTDGLSAEPLRQKASNLRLLIREAQILVTAAYGSNKDVSVYQSIGLHPDQIFIVGKVAKRNKSEATLVSGGYSWHLSDLVSRAKHSRPVNQKLSFRTGGFSLKHPDLTSAKPPKSLSNKFQPGTMTNLSFRNTIRSTRSQQPTKNKHDSC